MRTALPTLESRIERLAPKVFLGIAYCAVVFHSFCATARYYFNAPVAGVYGEMALMLAGLLFVLSYQGQGWPFSMMSIPFACYALCGLLAAFLPTYHFQFGVASLLVQGAVFYFLQIRPRYQ